MYWTVVMARQILFRTVTIEERERTSKYKGRWLFIARVRGSVLGK